MRQTLQEVFSRDVFQSQTIKTRTRENPNDRRTISGEGIFPEGAGGSLSLFAKNTEAMVVTLSIRTGSACGTVLQSAAGGDYCGEVGGAGVVFEWLFTIRDSCNFW